MAPCGGTFRLINEGRTAERIATDGVVAIGRSSLVVSAITGESTPIEAAPGDAVFAGSINGTGAPEVDLTAAVADNSLARIARIVEAAQERKGQGQRLADRIAPTPRVRDLLGR